jgi:hypothetical protein
VVFKRTAFEKAPRWVAVDFRHREALMRCFFLLKRKNNPTYAIGGKRGKMKKMAAPHRFSMAYLKGAPQKTLSAEVYCFKALEAVRAMRLK